MLLVSCGGKKEETGNILMRYGDRSISLEEVEKLIPDGIYSGDSVELFTTIIDSWLKDVVLEDFAEERLLDKEAIERRVRDYRNSLIVEDYLLRMRETQTPRIDEIKVREYYDNHRNEMKLEQPLVKGIFLKINKDAKGKEEIKNLISSDDPSSLDRLEQEWLDRALEYNYFRDKWIDWEALTGLVPYRFGDPMGFLSTQNYLQTQYDDCEYFLQISDFLPPGEEQPFEYAKTWINNILTQAQILDYEHSLVKSLIEKAIKDKKLERVGYDPLSHQFIEHEDTGK